MNAPKAKRVGDYHMVLHRQGRMQVEAHLFISKILPIEAQALEQLMDAASLPGVEHVVATADIHVGFGVPIGAVVASAQFISPAAVGYDINCGMRLITTPWTSADVDVALLARQVRSAIPLGEGKSNLRLKPKQLDRVLEEGVGALLGVMRADIPELHDPSLWDYVDLEEEKTVMNVLEGRGSLLGDPGAVSFRAKERGMSQLGTLGGGNHFIEFQRIDRIDDPVAARAWGLALDQLVIMIHSGSRGLGHEIGGHYMKMASKYHQERHTTGRLKALAGFPIDSREAKAYLGAMRAGANYAFANRQAMAVFVKAVIRRLFADTTFTTVYDVAHNLASIEQHAGKRLVVHRKGATRAFPGRLMHDTPFEDLGQPVLIPGSMGTSSYILRGVETGSKSLYSTNHGAGRVMSRTAALGRSARRGKKRSRTEGGGGISDAQFRESMQGIVLLCENYRSIKEEAPAAYKDIELVIQSVVGAELAAPVARMKPVAVLKG